MWKSKLIVAVLAAALLGGVATTAAAKSRTRRAKRGERVTGKLNINTAKVSQLKLLPRIGPSTARAIVKYRKAQRFLKVRDLMKVKGIGKRTFMRLKRHIEVSGPNTLRRIKSQRKKRRRARKPRRKRQKGARRG